MISIWEKETYYAPQDIIIAGSGFTGLWSALFLKKRKPDLRITIVDRGIIPTGASTRNAGFACFGSLTELLADEQRSGTEKMLELVEMRFKGLQKIKKIFSEKEIDFEMCGGYELFSKQDGLIEKDLAEQINYLNQQLSPIVGSKKTYQLPQQKIIKKMGFKNVGFIVKNNLEGYLHSGKLLKWLLQKVQTMGVQVLNNIEIKSFVRSNKGIQLESNLPVELFCDQLLVCTNAFAKQLLPGLDIMPARGQVLLTSPIERLPWKGTFHFDEGFYYFRNLGERVLLGGARNKAFDDENTFSLETTGIIQEELERFLKEVILPGKKFTITDRWSGTMGMGREKMPILQEVSKNIFCCVRMSGMGVALAPLLGEEIAGKMMK